MKRCVYMLAVTLLATSTGCFRTHMIMSRAAARSATQIDWEGRWYHDIIYGLAEISGPVRLDRVCPEGVAEVYQETSFLNGLVSDLTGSLYNPQSVSIYCVGGKGHIRDGKPTSPHLEVAPENAPPIEQ